GSGGAPTRSSPGSRARGPPARTSSSPPAAGTASRGSSRTCRGAPRAARSRAVLCERAATRNPTSTWGAWSSRSAWWGQRLRDRSGGQTTKPGTRGGSPRAPVVAGWRVGWAHGASPRERATRVPPTRGEGDQKRTVIWRRDGPAPWIRLVETYEGLVEIYERPGRAT